MASLSRKIKRKQELKIKKHNKKNLKRAMSALAGLPANCTTCKKEFNQETDLDTWVVHTENDLVSLFCDKCKPEESASSSSM